MGTLMKKELWFKLADLLRIANIKNPSGKTSYLAKKHPDKIKFLKDYQYYKAGRGEIDMGKAYMIKLSNISLLTDKYPTIDKIMKTVLVQFKENYLFSGFPTKHFPEVNLKHILKLNKRIKNEIKN